MYHYQTIKTLLFIIYSLLHKIKIINMESICSFEMFSSQRSIFEVLNCSRETAHFIIIFSDKLKVKQ